MKEDIHIYIDDSGSMTGVKRAVAQNLAVQILEEARSHPQSVWHFGSKRQLREVDITGSLAGVFEAPFRGGTDFNQIIENELSYSTPTVGVVITDGYCSVDATQTFNEAKDKRLVVVSLEMDQNNPPFAEVTNKQNFYWHELLRRDMDFTPYAKEVIDAVLNPPPAKPDGDGWEIVEELVDMIDKFHNVDISTGGWSAAARMRIGEIQNMLGKPVANTDLAIWIRRYHNACSGSTNVEQGQELVALYKDLKIEIEAYPTADTRRKEMYKLLNSVRKSLLKALDDRNE